MAKPSVETFDISSIIDTIKDSVLQQEEQQSIANRKIPSIMDFIYGKKYLNFTKQRIKLYPMQEIFFKVFYRGTEGNENVKLTEEEIKMLQDEGQEAVLEKYYSGATFRELILVLGRRSGKGFCVAIMALYEAMKLLECPGGSPYEYYGLAEGNPLFILTVAMSGDQAKILFLEMKSKLQSSDYFRNKLGRPTADKIPLFTKADRRKQKEFMAQGLTEMANSVEGSVVIMSGHSNSDSLLGKSVFCVKEDSWVLTSKGMVQIKDMNGHAVIHGLEGEKQSDRLFDNGIQKTLKFKTQSGNEIEVTEDHQLYVWDENINQCVFKESKHIKKNDFIVGQYGQELWGEDKNFDFEWSYSPVKYGEKIPCPVCGSMREQINAQHLKSHNMTCSEFKLKYPAHPTRSDAAIRKFNTVRNNKIPNRMNKKLSRLLGYFIAEGNNTAPVISLTNTEEDIVKDMHSCSSSNFKSVSVRSREHTNPNWKDTSKILINGRKELNFFEHIGCNRVTSERKEIPHSILNSSKKHVIEFLRGYFEGDGCVTAHKVEIFACSTSKKLIYQIYYLLLNMGIFSSIREKLYDNPKQKKQWLIYIRGHEAVKFAKQIGFAGKRKKKLAKNLIKIGTNRKQKQNIFGFPVSDAIYKINMANKPALDKYKKMYGFYGFSNQDTQSLKTIAKWNRIYNDNNIKSYLSEIIDKKFFAKHFFSHT